MKLHRASSAPLRDCARVLLSQALFSVFIFSSFHVSATSIFVDEPRYAPKPFVVSVAPDSRVHTPHFVDTRVKASEILQNDPFGIGTIVFGSRTLTATSEEDLIVRTAGKPREQIFAKYHGDFELYWRAAAPNFEGKTYEAMIVYRENQRLASMGDSRMLVLTGAEGYPGHAADIVMLDAERKVIAQYQVKMGWQKAIAALDEAKYEDMHIITTRESLEIIKKELAKAEAAAVQRGIPLSPKWQLVKDALRDKRLMDKLPSGLPLLLRKEVERGARSVYEKVWPKLTPKVAAMVRRFPPRMMVQLEKIHFAGRLSSEKAMARLAESKSVKIGTAILKNTAVIVDVGTNVHLTYLDYQRWNAGEIGGEYLGFKAGLRSAQMGLTYYTILTPDPTPVTRAIMGTLAVVLLTADIVSDPFYEAAIMRTRELLATIDREEQFRACRRVLRSLFDEPSTS